MSNVLGLMRKSVSASNGEDNGVNPFLSGAHASFAGSVGAVSASDFKHGSGPCLF